MLEHRASVNQQDNCGYTPLHVAIEPAGNENIVLLLIINRANVKQQTKSGSTPLHFAAGRGHEKIVRLLLEHGASETINQKDNFGDTPLHLAESTGHTSVVHLLEQWPHIPKLRAAKLAFCEILHPRLGANSPANILNSYLLREILQYLQPEDFATVNEPAAQPVRQPLLPWLWSLVKLW